MSLYSSHRSTASIWIHIPNSESGDVQIKEETRTIPTKRDLQWSCSPFVKQSLLRNTLYNSIGTAEKQCQIVLRQRGIRDRNWWIWDELVFVSVKRAYEGVFTGICHVHMCLYILSYRHHYAINISLYTLFISCVLFQKHTTRNLLQGIPPICYTQIIEF